MKMLTWPDPGKTRRGVIDGPAGALELDIRRAETDARGFALICHPHPQYQGTMDNKVVYTLARAATDVGMTAIRFNFRGVGNNAGAYDAGVGEVDDARAVRDWAIDASGLNMTALAGFSFGAAVALRLAGTDGATALVTVGLPSAYFDSGLPRPSSAWLAIFGDADDVIDVRASIAAVRELDPPVAVHVLEGAGHFMHGRLTDLREKVVQGLTDGID